MANSRQLSQICQASRRHAVSVSQQTNTGLTVEPAPLVPKLQGLACLSTAARIYPTSFGLHPAFVSQFDQGVIWFDLLFSLLSCSFDYYCNETQFRPALGLATDAIAAASQPCQLLQMFA